MKIKSVNLLIILGLVLPTLLMSVLPANAQTPVPPLILVLENPTSASALGFRFSPSQGVDNLFTCNLAGGPSTSFSVTGNGTLEGSPGHQDTQGGCEIFLGATQPDNVIGFRFIFSSYSGALTSIGEHDNTTNLSMSAHTTTGAGVSTPEKVCLTTAADNARVAAEIDCDTVANLFVLNPGGSEVGFAANGIRSPSQTGSNEAISFTINQIQWIVEVDEPPQQPPPPPGQDLLIPGTGSGMEDGCYICPEPISVFNVPLWIAKLICILKNLFLCRLNVWLLNVVNSIIGVRDSILSFFSWIAVTAQDFINWGAGLIQSNMDLFGFAWNFFTLGLPGLFSSIIDFILQTPLVKNILNADLIASTIIQIFKTNIILVFELISKIYDAVLQVVGIMTDIAVALFQAPTDIGTVDLANEFGLAGFDPGDLALDGANDSKILWLFLSWVGAFDFAIGVAGFDQITGVLIGIMSLTLSMWTLNKWRDILPI